MRPQRFGNLILIGMFFAGSFLYFDLHYRYWYHFMEQFGLFLYTNSYFLEFCREPGGMNEYLNEALMQFFYLPHVASVCLASLLGLITVSAHLFFRRCGYLLSTLWSILPCFLFWIYPPETVAIPLSMLTGILAVVGYTYSPRNNWRYAYAAGILVTCYLLATPAHFLAAILLSFYEFKSASKSKYMAVTIYIGGSMLLPLIAMRTLFVVPMEEAFFSKYLYHPEYPQPGSFRLFWLVFPLVTTLSVLLQKWQPKVGHKLVISFVILTGGIIAGIVYGGNALEQTYRYDYYARNSQWQKIVDHAEQQAVNDQNALIYVNLALSHTNQLANKQFDFRQAGVDGLIPKDPVTRVDLITASEVAWQIGHINSSQRYAFVGVLSSERRVQPRLMKRLVETYLVNEEYKAAEKYITILEASLFYRDLANEKRQYLNRETAGKTPWIVQKRAVNVTTDNPFDPAKALPNALAYLLDDHPGNKAAIEYTMAYVLLYKDLGAFMQYMQTAKGFYKTLPVHYQEAICLFYAAVQPDPEAFKTFKIDKAVYDRFIGFCNAAGNSQELLKKQFGNTYYYYAQFENMPNQEQL